MKSDCSSGNYRTGKLSTEEIAMHFSTIKKQHSEITAKTHH